VIILSLLWIIPESCDRCKNILFDVFVRKLVVEFLTKGRTSSVNVEVIAPLDRQFGNVTP
jgi:hypothetical protein